MANGYTLDDLLEFLDHAGDKGLMPAATAQALAVASRNVLGVLSDQERQDLSKQDMDSVIKRFTNKRAKDFNTSSLKEYGRRVHRAIDLFLKWREDPSNFTVRTRATGGSRKKGKSQGAPDDSTTRTLTGIGGHSRPGTYQSSVPVRPGVVVTISDLPQDLSRAEAEKIATFVRMLASDS